MLEVTAQAGGTEAIACTGFVDELFLCKSEIPVLKWLL